MATQKRKYGGKDLLNNRVVVDYEKKVVRFTPLSENKKTWTIIQFIITHFMLYSIVPSITLYAIMFTTIGIELATSWEFPTKFYWAILAILFLPAIICATIRSLQLTNKEFRKDIYPEYNVKMSIAINQIITFGKGKKKEQYRKLNKRTLNPDNTILVPLFGNMQFNYKATKDFSRQLKKIEIAEIFLREDCGEWFARVHFKKRPINGQFSIQYI